MKTLFISLLATSFLLGSISNANTCPAWVQNETTNCSTLSTEQCYYNYICDGGNCSAEQKNGDKPVNRCIWDYTGSTCMKNTDQNYKCLVYQS